MFDLVGRKEVGEIELNPEEIEDRVLVFRLRQALEGIVRTTSEDAVLEQLDDTRSLVFAWLWLVLRRHFFILEHGNHGFRQLADTGDEYLTVLQPGTGAADHLKALFGRQ